MKFSTTAIAATLSTAALASPIEKRSAINDTTILNYALTLEHLEATFYAQGLKNFTQQQFAKAGFNDAFYKNLQIIASDEATHVSTLTSVIEGMGQKAVEQCSYSFPYTTPKTFVELASVLEGVGVSAYLGAAKDIASKFYLTAAGSILTVEARHDAYIRNSINEVPFAYPFDTPLDFNEVYTLAGAFITGCPSDNPMLPFTPFPSLSILNAATPIMAGEDIYLITPTGFQLPKTVYAAWPTVLGPIFTEVTQSTNGQSAWTTVPKGIAGETYVIITKNNKSLTDGNTVAGPAIVEVGDAPS